MVNVVKKIGTHALEADYSQWTGVAKIRLDGEELLSKFLIRPFGRDHIEMVSVGRKQFCVKFGGWMLYNATITEMLSPEGSEILEKINEPEFKPSALKEQKNKLVKINSLLEKLDEKLAQGEITETRYKELCEQYRDKAGKLKNQVTEQELMQEVGLKGGEMEEAGYHKEEPEKPLGRISTIPDKKSVAVAVVLSFFIPGLGQIYCGKVARGVGFLALSILMVFLFTFAVSSNPTSSEPFFPFLLWILVYIWNIYDAYKLAERINRGEA